MVVELRPGVAPTALGVDARPLVAPPVARRLTVSAGRMGRRAPDLGRWVAVRGDDAVMAALRRNPGVATVARLPDTPPEPPQDICRTLPPRLANPPLSLGSTPIPDLEPLNDVRRAFNMADLPAGGDGAGVRVADIEYEWEPEHIELADRGLPASRHMPETPPENISHGTSALSLIGASADGAGTTGLAPAAELLPIAPWAGSTYSPASAIAEAADRLRPGDVILIEQQSHQRGPADTGVYGDSVADAIAAASAKGIVVVLPAGNGGLDLDGFGMPRSDTALLVGGGETGSGGVPGARSRLSNAGPRIDVQGPAHGVVAGTSTPSYYGVLLVGQTRRRSAYTHCFNGTSSASASVAGAIAAIQGIARAQRGAPFTPAELRQRLLLTGRPQPDPENGWVGPMPQVAQAADLQPPSPPAILGPAAGTVPAGVVRVRWRSGVDGPGQSGSSVDRVVVDGRVVAEVAHGVGVAGVTLTAGTHTVEVRSSDLVGNSATASVVVTAQVPPPAAKGPSPLAVPPPPSAVAVQRPAGVLRRVGWNRARGILVLRVRTVAGARVFVGRRSRPVRNGLVRVRLRRPVTALVRIRARGHRNVRYRINVRAPGPVLIRELPGRRLERQRRRATSPATPARP